MAEPFSIGKDSNSRVSDFAERPALPQCQIEVNSRISLSRNLATFPFFDACSVRQRQEIQSELMQSRLWRTHGETFAVLDCQQMKLHEHQFLIDLQAIVGLPLSPEMDEPEAAGTARGSLSLADHVTETFSRSTANALPAPPAANSGLPSGEPAVASEIPLNEISPNEILRSEILRTEISLGQARLDDFQVNLILNGEDHLRIELAGSGNQLSGLWRQLNAYEDAFAQDFDFAFHDRYGYLTASPAETGTGLRASLLLHLPGLVAMGVLPQIQSRLLRYNAALREAFGDPGGGEFFRLSNQATLGLSEADLLHKLELAAAEIVVAEQQARQAWLVTAADELQRLANAAVHAVQALDLATLDGPLEESLKLSLLRALSHLRLGRQLKLLEPAVSDLLAGKFRIIRLQSLLKIAIGREDYRAASRIRDRIKVLGEAA